MFISRSFFYNIQFRFRLRWICSHDIISSCAPAQWSMVQKYTSHEINHNMIIWHNRLWEWFIMIYRDILPFLPGFSTTKWGVHDILFRGIQWISHSMKEPVQFTNSSHQSSKFECRCSCHLSGWVQIRSISILPFQTWYRHQSSWCIWINSECMNVMKDRRNESKDWS